MATAELGRDCALPQRAQRCSRLHRLGLSAALCYSLDEFGCRPSRFRPQILRRAIPPVAGWTVSRRRGRRRERLEELRMIVSGGLGSNDGADLGEEIVEIVG